ncbi:hypothetical protein QOZ80_6AG0550380 [Eleusine coracana subsp. coracana]|nr:hypothetical protein QOZ80_6AG0550380 [Eleusine coracana subsp. coracana]
MSASDCVILRADALRDKIFYCKGTAARARTSRDLTIEVSLSCPCPERPLLPTVLFVSVPGVNFTSTNHPCIVRAVEDLILIRVPMVRWPLDDDYDYFIYRPGGEKGPSLKLLPSTTFFHDADVGLLRRGEEHYTVAALLATGKLGVYDLHRFDSVTEKWSIDEVPLVEPQVSFPYKKIPMNSQRLLFHLTSTVISIGGESGTMGWVDLWHGILLCDMLSTEPKLRGVPLPLPLDQLSCNNGLVTHLGCPRSLRAIAVIGKPGMEPCLKFVHLGVSAVPIHANDGEEEEEDWKMHDWTITTWSNKKMTTNWEDWHMDCKEVKVPPCHCRHCNKKMTTNWEDWHMDCKEVKASCTSISSNLSSTMLKSGLLSPGGIEPERAFQNLLVSTPAVGIDDGVVYLQARIKFWDPKVFVLALDTRDNKLIDAVEFATERIRGTGIVCFPSNISKYVDPENRRVVPIPKGVYSRASASQYCKGTTSQKLPRIKLRIMRRLYGPTLEELSLDDATIAT